MKEPHCVVDYLFNCHKCGQYRHTGAVIDFNCVSCVKCGERILPRAFRKGLNRFDVWAQATEEERQEILAYWESC